MPIEVRNFFDPNEFHREPSPGMEHWLKWISSRVATARAKRGWTIEQVARVANLPIDYIYQVEAGIIGPSHLAREKLAYALECNKGYLESYEPPGQKKA